MTRSESIVTNAGLPPSMPACVHFTVPGAARGKGRPRATTIGGHARMYTDAKTVSYENLVKIMAMEAMSGRPPIAVPVSMAILVRIAVPKSSSKKLRAEMLTDQIKPAKKPDLTNIIKAVEDGSNCVVYVDDSLIVCIEASKVYAEIPGVDVWVEALDS